MVAGDGQRVVGVDLGDGLGAVVGAAHTADAASRVLVLY